MEDVVIKVMTQLPPLFFAFVVHEFAHALTAYKLGDTTSKYLGRLTLNPIAHIDLFNTILLPLILIMSGSPIIFAAAKPVPINPSNFKNPSLGMMIVALAGPFSNLVLAFIFAFIAFNFNISPNIEFGSMAGLFSSWIYNSILINIVLCIFNLIPIPPLDGSRVLEHFLPYKISQKYSALEPFGFFIVILITSIPIFKNIFIFLVQTLFNFIIYLIS